MDSLRDDMFRPLRLYATFKGRARRREYWLFILLSWLICGVIAGVGMALGWQPLTAAYEWKIIPGADATSLDRTIFWLLMAVIALLFLPTIAVQVRRFHDRGNSAWMLLWHIVPYAGELVILYAMVMPGTVGPNRYGDDPTDPLDEYGYVRGTRPDPGERWG